MGSGSAIIGGTQPPPIPCRSRRRLPAAARWMLLLAAGLCLGWAETWEGIRAAAAPVKTISADFIQEKHLPMLARPLVSEGRLSYRRPDALRWEYTAPVRSVLLVNGGDTRRFVQTDQGWVEDAGARLQAMQFVMPEIGGWLGGRFDDNALFDAVLTDGHRIRLHPKEPGLARFIQRIELVMDPQPGVIREVLIFEAQDAYTRMVFSATRVNPVLDDRLFQDVP